MSTNELEAYNSTFVPWKGRGLNNTGVICHENSILQALVSCSAVIQTTFANRDYLAKTVTGRAFYDFICTAMPTQSQPFDKLLSYEDSSANVLAAVVYDLCRRRPFVKYGPNQESASESLIHLLDMIDAPDGEENPIARLFYHRYQARIFCTNCKTYISESTDVAVHFDLFAYNLKDPSPREFGDYIRNYETFLENYRCDKCDKKIAGIRKYRLRLVPEVIVCLFNLYDDSRARVARSFPERILFPGLGGIQLHFRQVAQIEHHGHRNGGHYSARGLRGDGQVYQFNDRYVAPSSFAPTPNVYMVFYHHCTD